MLERIHLERMPHGLSNRVLRVVLFGFTTSEWEDVRRWASRV
jgi:hypothetical protein